MDIMGRDLATALHVDYSLISKWKNNKRPLTLRSMYLHKIADYILSIDTAAKKEFLMTLLKDYDPNLNTAAPKDVHSCLCRWLSESSQSLQNYNKLIIGHNKNAYQTGFKVFKENKGRRTAVLELLDYVLSMSEGQQLFLISQEDMSWLTEDATFLNLWNQKLTQILEKNHKLKIIHSVDREIVELAAIIRQWLPLHLTGGIESYYIPKYVDSSLKITLFIVQNTLALTGIVIDENIYTRYTALYDDYTTVKMYEKIFDTWLANSHPLIEVHSLEDTDHFLSKVYGMGQRQENSYFYTDMPLFITMSESLLIEVLHENNIEENMIKQCLFYHKQVNQNFHSNIAKITNRHIYNFAKLEHFSQTDRLFYNDLSLITGNNIFVSKEHFRKHLLLLIERLENNDNFEIALLSGDKNPNMIPIILWFKQNSIITAWSSVTMPYALTASEPTLVNAFYYYYESIWNSIPRINRRKDWVKNELLKLISNL